MILPSFSGETIDIFLSILIHVLEFICENGFMDI